MKIQLKKINTSSPIYALTRICVNTATAIGGMAALESVVLPWLNVVYRKHPVIRALGWLGTLGLSYEAGIVAANGIDWCIDSYVDFWNSMAGAINGENDISEPEHDDNLACKPAEESPATQVVVFNDDILTEAVANSKMFEFKTEEDAKKVVENLPSPCSLKDFACVRLMMDKNYSRDLLAKIDIPEADLCGWKTNEDFEIEQINDNIWFVDGLNYEVLEQHIHTFNTNREFPFFKED